MRIKNRKVCETCPHAQKCKKNRLQLIICKEIHKNAK